MMVYSVPSLKSWRREVGGFSPPLCAKVKRRACVAAIQPGSKFEARGVNSYVLCAPGELYERAIDFVDKV